MYEHIPVSFILINKGHTAMCSFSHSNYCIIEMFYWHEFGMVVYIDDQEQPPIKLYATTSCILYLLHILQEKSF